MADEATATGASRAPTTPVLPRANPGVVLGALALAGLVSAVLQSLVVPALPAIARELKVTLEEVRDVRLLSEDVLADGTQRSGSATGGA